MARKSSEERREEITSALLRTMARHGYAKATISRIAEEADLTPGLVHYHFASKQEILLELIDGLVRREQAGIAETLQTAAKPPEKLRRLIDAILATGESARPDAVAAWVAVAAEALRQPEVREAFAGALAALSNAFQTVIEDGVDAGVFQPIDELDVEAGAAALTATVHGYFTLAATAPDVIPSGTAAEATWQMARGLLGLRESEEDLA